MTSEEKTRVGFDRQRQENRWYDRTGKTDIIYASPESLVGD